MTTVTEGSRVTTVNYDSLNQIDSITYAAGRTVSFDYDLAGRVTTQTLPDGRIIAYSYDANGNVTSITPPGRPSHNFTFDPRDLEIYYNPTIRPLVPLSLRVRVGYGARSTPTILINS